MHNDCYIKTPRRINLQFETLGIDIRLAKQLAHQAITEPTEIQQKSIPVVIAGKD